MASIGEAVPRLGVETIRRLTVPSWRASPRQHGGAKRAPTEQEAELGLGDARPPLGLAEIDQQPGLDTLNLFWAGQSLARSQRERRPSAGAADRSADDCYYCAAAGRRAGERPFYRRFDEEIGARASLALRTRREA